MTSWLRRRFTNTFEERPGAEQLVLAAEGTSLWRHDLDPHRVHHASPPPGIVDLDAGEAADPDRSTIPLGGLAVRAGKLVHRDLTIWTPDPSALQRVGVAVADRRDRATLQGVSDRLGWEAAVAWGLGVDLPTVQIVSAGTASVLDGRLGHNVATVVVVAEHMVRWAAGSTWEHALQRAMYSPRTPGRDGVHAELQSIADVLDEAGLSVGALDVGTEVLRSSGVYRLRVHLLDDVSRS